MLSLTVPSYTKLLIIILENFSGLRSLHYRRLYRQEALALVLRQLARRVGVGALQSAHPRRTPPRALPLLRGGSKIILIIASPRNGGTVGGYSWGFCTQFSRASGVTSKTISKGMVGISRRRTFTWDSASLRRRHRATMHRCILGSGRMMHQGFSLSL